MNPIVAECGLVSDLPDNSVIVVAAAILDADDRLLAARRDSPAELAGGWEFPGGKVEAGETEVDALARELVEELGVKVDVGERVGGVYPLKPGYVLHVYRASIVEGEPEPLEDHDAVRWLDPGEWWSVLWLDADRAVVEELETLQEG